VAVHVKCLLPLSVIAVTHCCPYSCSVKFAVTFVRYCCPISSQVQYVNIVKMSVVNSFKEIQAANQMTKGQTDGWTDMQYEGNSAFF
jgi:hypothetical protein